MRLRFHSDVEDFASSAVPWYARRPLVHTVELTLLREGVPSDEVPLLMTVWDGAGAGAELLGAAIRTPPLPLLCGGLSTAPTGEVVGDMVAAGLTLPGARGPRGATEPFARQWCDATGAVPTPTSAERLYRLGTLTAPSGVPGGHRVARKADEPVLVKYQCEFAAEAFGHVPDPARAAASLTAAAEAGNAYLLWTAAGAPVSMAGVRRPAAGVSRIGPVYTAPEVRGRGYGAAVTAAACRWALAAGATQVVLFADLDNPTSNRVYQRLGFVPVGDSVTVDFRVP
ncbi:GNAT family N-acetyltransferase [Mycolicibacterium litorale]|uniref:Acetyltransferase n=1 Tax=Mycolicibacterium litorale TaxID=758802 RepID=A0AAD1IQD8_9MYCO|nr:GNAT family N-acetyltransferase [Mycolicibacterium litorale]MCV7418889.1 GNAT family N-acetyltransferase [Mycolicibacterium litorale]TDY00325.1 putative GNAT family acetyltransferase [Mycolicibacterium litorale]BBY15843.1 putative acetyltransferase [Mycolicibacterium litorale]